VLLYAINGTDVLELRTLILSMIFSYIPPVVMMIVIWKVLDYVSP